MTSLYRHLSVVTNHNGSAAQKIVNWVTTADGCVHTTDSTRLDFAVGKFVQTRRACRQLVANCVCTTPMRLNSTVELRRRRRCILDFSDVECDCATYTADGREVFSQREQGRQRRHFRGDLPRRRGKNICNLSSRRQQDLGNYSPVHQTFTHRRQGSQWSCLERRQLRRISRTYKCLDSTSRPLPSDSCFTHFRVSSILRMATTCDDWHTDPSLWGGSVV